MRYHSERGSMSDAPLTSDMPLVAEINEARRLAHELWDAIRTDVLHQGDVPLHHAVEWTDDRLAQMWDLLTMKQRIDVLLDLRLHEELALRLCPELHARECVALMARLDAHAPIEDRIRAVENMWSIIFRTMDVVTTDSVDVDVIVQSLGPPTLEQIVAAAKAWGPPGPSRSPSSQIMSGPLAQRPAAGSVPVGTLYVSTDGVLAIACAFPADWKALT